MKHFVFRQIQPHECGFDYAAALIEVHRHLSYEQIAEFCGYEGKSSIAYILQGRVPNHRQGEALYILYSEMFGRKPPVKSSLK